MQVQVRVHAYYWRQTYMYIYIYKCKYTCKYMYTDIRTDTVQTCMYMYTYTNASTCTWLTISSLMLTMVLIKLTTCNYYNGILTAMINTCSCKQTCYWRQTYMYTDTHTYIHVPSKEYLLIY